MKKRFFGIALYLLISICIFFWIIFKKQYALILAIIVLVFFVLLFTGKIVSFEPKPAWRFLFMLIFVIFLYFSFFPIKTTSSLKRISSQGANNTSLILEDNINFDSFDFDVSNLWGTLWSLINPKKFDTICFKNNGASIGGEKRVKYGKINSSVDYNQESFFVKDTECRLLPEKDNNLTFRWRFDVGLPEGYTINVTARETYEESLEVYLTYCYPNSLGYFCDKRVTFDPDIKSYLTVRPSIQILRFLFLFFSIGALLWALSRTFFLIKYGWDKKV